MKNQDKQTAQQWAEEWLNGVADGSSTMSQRKLSSVISKGGGVDVVRTMAREKGVHLVQVTDDKGNELLAASTHPFTVIC